MRLSMLVTGSLLAICAVFSVPIHDAKGVEQKGYFSQKPCKTDADCDDQLFCTGHESCVDMSDAEDGSVMRCFYPDESPCKEGQFCSEALNKCFEEE